ncbi:hypothetical protein J6590_105372 [Homalodisca vitripennis]|nr:hypothetical protein J6590_105372 [Homalodisca vitripennis]
MSSYKPNSLVSIEDKRTEVLQKLQEVSAMEAVTNLLLMLFDEPERPENAVEYLREKMGNKRHSAEELVNLRTELAAAKIKICILEDEVNILNEKLQSCELKGKLKDIPEQAVKTATELDSKNVTNEIFDVNSS